MSRPDEEHDQGKAERFQEKDFSPKLAQTEDEDLVQADEQGIAPWV